MRKKKGLALALAAAAASLASCTTQFVWHSAKDEGIEYISVMSSGSVMIYVQTSSYDDVKYRIMEYNKHFDVVAEKDGKETSYCIQGNAVTLYLRYGRGI